MTVISLSTIQNDRHRGHFQLNPNVEFVVSNSELEHHCIGYNCMGSIS